LDRPFDRPLLSFFTKREEAGMVGEDRACSEAITLADATNATNVISAEPSSIGGFTAISRTSGRCEGLFGEHRPIFSRTSGR